MFYTLARVLCGIWLTVQILEHFCLMAQNLCTSSNVFALNPLHIFLVLFSFTVKEDTRTMLSYDDGKINLPDGEENLKYEWLTGQNDDNNEDDDDDEGSDDDEEEEDDNSEDDADDSDASDSEEEDSAEDLNTDSGTY